jgi:hypothetical protein
MKIGCEAKQKSKVKRHPCKPRKKSQVLLAKQFTCDLQRFFENNKVMQGILHNSL